MSEAVTSLVGEPEATEGEEGPRRRRLALLLVALVAVALVAVGLDRMSQGRPGPPPGSWTLTPYRGLGAWVDAYDWTTELGGSTPSVGPDEIDAMADAGVQTLFLQTGHQRSVHDVIEPERLDELIDRAHANDMHVVAWYLPTLTDPARDLRRLVAASELKVDGLAVDIEAVNIDDVPERTRRQVELNASLRAAIDPDRPIGAITLSAVHLQVVNTSFWPGYPWADIGRTYDVLLPMAYWSIRTGDLRDGGRYVAENIDRLRSSTGDPDLPIHVVGGIADGVTDADLDGMLAAAQAGGAIGGSLYDWATSHPDQWARLAPLAALRNVPSADDG